MIRRPGLHQVGVGVGVGVHARPRLPEMLSDARNAVPCSQAKISRDAGADGDAMRCGAVRRCDAMLPIEVPLVLV